MQDSGSDTGATGENRPADGWPWDAPGLHKLISGVLVGIGGVYLTTGSVVITVTAGAAVTILVGLILLAQR